MKYLNAPLLPYDSSRWIVGKFMKAMWKLLNESPALKGEICSSSRNQFVPIVILWT